MADNKYQLQYLPLFYEDLEVKVLYIAEKLGNPKAANDLIDDVEKAILERLPMAEAWSIITVILTANYLKSIVGVSAPIAV